MKGWIGVPSHTPCGYFQERTATTEGAYLAEVASEELDLLLPLGIRHFAEEFFRPRCESCGRCLPLRVKVNEHVPSKNERRILKRGRLFTSQLESPAASEEAWEIYLKHKQRFPLDSEGELDYATFCKVFFSPSPSHRILTLRDGKKLVLVSHIDITARSLSAVYCYYDSDYARYSPGTLAILQELELARGRNIEYLYLGYWIEGHPHMDYKKKFAPNQLLLTGDSWYDYLGPGGETVLDGNIPLNFVAARSFEELFS